MNISKLSSEQKDLLDRYSLPLAEGIVYQNFNCTNYRGEPLSINDYLKEFQSRFNSESDKTFISFHIFCNFCSRNSVDIDDIKFSEVDFDNFKKTFLNKGLDRIGQEEFREYAISLLELEEHKFCNIIDENGNKQDSNTTYFYVYNKQEKKISKNPEHS